MYCISPTYLKVDGRHMYVPCGQCVACKVNRTQEWTIRLVAECNSWEHSSFVTLTFDDEHLADNNLDKKDLQSFFKRLRFNLEASQPGRRIKYYACGEYGDRTKRKHYHSIIYGLDPYCDDDRQIVADSWRFCKPWKFLDRRQNCIGTVTKDSCQYVAGYCQKKLFGDKALQEYGDKQPPFSVSSQGLGLEYFSRYKDELNESGYVPWKGAKVSIPKFIKKKLDLTPSYTESAFEQFLKKVVCTDVDKDLLERAKIDPDTHDLLMVRNERDEFRRRMEQYKIDVDARNNLRRNKGL